MNNNVTPNNNYPPMKGAPYGGAPGGTSYIPPEYQPVSMWGYFGYQILFAIPFIGFVALIILAFGARNINVKNFARSYFCLFIILAIVAGIILITGLGAGLTSQLMNQM